MLGAKMLGANKIKKMLSADKMKKYLFYKDTVSLTLRFPLQGNAKNVRYIKFENAIGLEDLKARNIKYNLPKFMEAEIKQLKGEVCFKGVKLLKGDGFSKKKPQEFQMSEFYELVKSYSQEDKSPDTGHLLNSFIFAEEKSTTQKSTDVLNIPDFEEFDFVDITDIHLYGEKARVSYKDRIVNEGLMPGFGLRIFYSNIRECILSKANQGPLTDENKGTLSAFWAIEAETDIQRDFHEKFFDTCFADSSGDFETIWLKEDTFVLDTNLDELNEFLENSDKTKKLVIQCALDLGPDLSIAYGIEILLPINPTMEAVRGGGAPVYVDFGTSSTCIARKRETQKDDYSLVRLSHGGESEDEEYKYENSSNLLIYNFDNLHSHLNELKSNTPTPLYALLDDHTVADKNDRKDFAFGGTLENTLKKELLGFSGNDIITEKFLDSYLKEVKTIPYRNAQGPSVTIKSFWGQKSAPENITLGREKDFDPIMLYGYLVGYRVNGPYKKNLYTNFKLSMPVKFHDEIKDSVLASFEEGLRYSLPQKIELSVGISCSEPAAIIKAMIGEDINKGKEGKSESIIFDISEDNRESKLFAIFDYGGGTLDMAGGLLRGPCGTDGVSERKESRTKVLQWLAEDGDADIGGEKIIEHLTHVFTLENLEQFVENEISMPLPPKEVWESSGNFELKKELQQDKGESTDYEYVIYEKYGESSSDTKLVKDKELAERNFKMITETFSRKYWYNACPEDAEALGLLKEVTLIRNDRSFFNFAEGSSRYKEGNTDTWKLNFGTPLRDFLKKEAIDPFQRFLQNLQNPDGPNRNEFFRHEYHGEKDPLYVFMAGNVCKSKIIDELFDEMYTELYEGKDDAVLNKAKSRLLNLAQHPVDKVEKNCKTIVAIGASCSSPYIREISIPKQRFLYDICWKLDKLILFASKNGWEFPPRYRECVAHGTHFYDNIDEFLDAFRYGEYPDDLSSLLGSQGKHVKATFARFLKDLILEICPVEGQAQNELKLKCYEKSNPEDFEECTLVLKEV